MGRLMPAEVSAVVLTDSSIVKNPESTLSGPQLARSSSAQPVYPYNQLKNNGFSEISS